MKIIFYAILFLFSICRVCAGENEYISGNSLVSTYYTNAKKLIKSNPTDCIFWADKAINESKISGTNLDLGYSLYLKGLALEYLHQNKASIQVFHETMKVALNFKLTELEMEALNKISKLYASSGDYKSAVMYASLLQDRKDSNVIFHQRILAKTLPGKEDLKKGEIKMKQLLTDNSVLDDHLRSNLKMIDNQGNWILIIVIGYSLIFLTFIIVKLQNRLILVKNKDLTEHMHTMEVGKMELDHTRYKAEESDRLKTSFLANISYEIRTPLNAIVSFAGFLRQNGKPEVERKKYIDVIHQYSESLLSLINEIFEVARIESGEIKQNPVMINVNEFLQEIHSQFCSESNQEIIDKHKFSLKLQPELTSCEIETYPERLKNVVIHLIENALKYSENGQIEFGYVVKEPFIEFYVIEEGKGFPNDKIEDIFERFRATEDFPKPGSGPLGLGLTISKNFIESMGGHIWVTSNIDRGSTFYFTLPIKLDI